MAGYARIGIHPAKELQPGRYCLDRTGRLHPIALGRFVKAVCIVTVRVKDTVAVEMPLPQEVRVKPEPVVTILREDPSRRSVQADNSRLVAAFRRKGRLTPPEQPTPKAYARSREPCALCGTPGFRGCSHQLPYQEWSA